MRAAKGREQKAKNEIFAPCSLRPMLHALCFTLCALCSLALFFCGCSTITPPVDYYQQVLEMEEYGEQSRRDTGRRPGEIIEPAVDSKPVVRAKSPVQQLTPDESQREPEKVVNVEPEEETLEEPEMPPQREAVEKPAPSPEVIPKPIAISSDVIKSALRTADLGINTRTVELVNGRLSGGRNSVRVSFLPESVDTIDDRFVAICAVIYHLNSGSNTVDVVVGIAEDAKANLLAIIQSDMRDITAWMTNEITRTEWFSRVDKKML